jgi:hypothetical protein
VAEARKRKSKSTPEKGDNTVTAEDKIARLLGLLLVKDIKKQNEKVPLLRTAGFSVGEVAEMLSMDENQVSVVDYKSRRKRKAR